jgi:flagellar M-ring protein FliF
MENVPVPINPAVAAMPLPTTSLGVMQSNVSRQPIMKQLGFLLAIAASIAIGGYVFMWSMSPNYQVLFSGMQPKEASEVVSILQSSGVKYKLDPSTGQLLVPASKVQSLRLKLAAEGLPRSAAPGMDILSEDQGFGTSQFVERARYQKALEEELARSIIGIQNIRSARVHLAVPKQSMFVRDRKEATASVVVNLYAGRSLEQGQVAAITHMVAASVPNMKSANVNVVDQRGNLLTQPERDKSITMSNNQFQYTQKLEKLYISRIEDILSPIVGIGGVRAQVVAEVDFTVTEQTHESYNPDMAVLRSEQVHEENRMAGREAFGVPGALSNQPPRAASTTVEENIVGEDGETVSPVLPLAKGSNSKRLTRNFELDRTISHTRVAPGSVRKLSVAVLVDEHRSVDDSGDSVSTPLTESEMTRINALVMDAIGFSKARGDTLNIVNAAFLVPDVVEALPEIPIWEQPWVWDVVKQGLGGLVILFLILGVIRPAFKDLNKVSAGSAQAMDAAGMPIEQTAAVAAKKGPAIELTTGAGNLEGQLDDVRSLVQQDPALVAQVVKNWAASE